MRHGKKKMKRIILVALAICMMYCFAGCHNANGGEEQQVKYVLYCGLNDADFEKNDTFSFLSRINR